MDYFVLYLFSSNTVLVFLTIIAFLIISLHFNLHKMLSFKYINSNNNNKENDKVILKKAPGPKNIPIIGSLASLDGYEVPYQAFNDLAKRYGDIYNLKLGSVNAIVVNGIENIKEVLIYKGINFDGRPNFKRYHHLFSGNKENSLAFCNWSEIHKARRDMLIPHTFPRNFTSRFNTLDGIIISNLQTTICELKHDSINNRSIKIKPMLLNVCAQVFTNYFASKSFDKQNKQFQNMINNFDKIFYEMNQGYAADFLPFLMPFHSKKIKEMHVWSEEIRKFVVDNIIVNRIEMYNERKMNNVDNNNDQHQDYLESLIEHVNEGVTPKLEWDTALFALEDIIGGHSAIGNFLVKVFGYISSDSNVQKIIQQEIEDVVAERDDRDDYFIHLCDRNKMPYTDAVIMESLRLIASPIVPHVANKNCSIGEYEVKKDTLILLNNYDLSMSTSLWDEPAKFKPERFLRKRNLVKPDFFLPFGGGRRSCMGYKIVQLLSFSIISNILKTFIIERIAGNDYKIPVGSLAMPEKTFDFKFRLRV